MRNHPRRGTVFLIGLVVLGLACDGTLNTGTAAKPVNDKPASDGTCPPARGLCGTGVFAICVDLQNDPSHCGGCEHACSPGIACQAGVCQQTLCTGSSIPVSSQVTTNSPVGGDDNSVIPVELLADVNGDGRLDLVDVQYGPVGAVGVDRKTFRVSLGQTAGGFAAPETYRSAFDIRTITATDANNDGVDDLLVFSSANLPVPPSRMEVWLGHPDGHLTLSSATDVNAIAFPMAVGDLSGDGWPDLVTSANYSQDKLNVFLSDSTGALHLSNTYATGYAGELYIKDWDRDGRPDIVVQGSTLTILYNRGDGTFGPPVDCGVLIPGAVAMADFNGDGLMDLAMGNEGASIGVSLGSGGCAFTPVTFYDVPGRALPDVVAADMNGDGQLDLVSISNNYAIDQKTGAVIAPDDFLLATLLGNGDGTFRLPDGVTSLGAIFPSTQVLVGEVTGDQRPDIIIPSMNGQVTTMENTCQ
jgi:hypothetical protein